MGRPGSGDLILLLRPCFLGCQEALFLIHYFMYGWYETLMLKTWPGGSLCLKTFLKHYFCKFDRNEIFPNGVYCSVYFQSFQCCSSNSRVPSWSSRSCKLMRKRNTSKMWSKDLLLVWSAQLTLVVEICSSLVGTVIWFSWPEFNYPGRREEGR